MSKIQSQKGWMVGAVVLLLPLTGIVALLVVVSYPAYPIPLTPLQVVFDLGMLILVAATVSAWRLTVLHLRAGRAGLQSAHTAWFSLVGLSAIMGVVTAVITIVHMLAPEHAPDIVGFALLSPAVLLVPVWVLLRMERRAKAG